MLTATSYYKVCIQQVDPNGTYHIIIPRYVFIVNCRQLWLLRRSYISDGHPLPSSILFGRVMVEKKSCWCSSIHFQPACLPAQQSEVMTIFPSGLRAHQKKRDSKMPKSPTDFQRATDSEVGGVYFMVLNSQPFWLVLRWQKCVLENFGSILRVQSWVEKDFCGRLGDFFAKLFVKSKLFFEDHGWMNQWTWIDWSDWICSFVQSFPDRFYMDSSKTEMQRKDQARRVLASQGWLEIGKGTEWNSLINIYIYTHHVISCHIISYHIISYHDIFRFKIMWHMQGKRMELE